MTEKIRLEHLRRAAYVYVRQSTARQVRHHQESRQRQYALADRARTLGFADTVVIDEDQGKNGSGRQAQSGPPRRRAGQLTGPQNSSSVCQSRQV